MTDADVAPEVRDIEHFIGEFQRIAGSDSALARASANIVILGSRGTGKSTLLRLSSKHLASEPTRVVLPTIDPELLHPGDSLMTWVLSGLETLLTKSELLHRLGDELTMAKLIDDLRRNYVLVSADLPRSLVQRGVGPAEYARDASKLTPIGMNITAAWTGLLDALAEVKNSSNLLVILPIDDVDLHPVRLSEVLNQLEILRTSPRFASIVAADEPTLIHNLIFGDENEAQHWDRAVQYGFIERTDLADLADRKFTKHFPRQYRIRLADVPFAKRLVYSPIESPTKTVGELLQEFPLNYAGLSNLNDLFHVRANADERIAPNHYAQALSGNRRDLQQLHLALSAELEKNSDTGTALAIIIDHGLEACRNRIPAAARKVVTLGRESGRPSISFDFTQIILGRASGRGYLLFSPREHTNVSSVERRDAPQMRIYLRRLVRFYSNFDEGQEGGEAEVSDSKSKYELPDMYTALMALGWESQEIENPPGRTLIPLDHLWGRLTLPGLRNWTGTINETVDAPMPYLMVPQWEEFSDYFSYLYGWNAIVDYVETAIINEFSRLRLTELMVLAHLRLVISIQRSKTVNIYPARRVIAKNEAAGMQSAALTSAAWDDIYHQAVSSLSRDMHDLLDASDVSGRGNGTRIDDFLLWSAIGFPLTTTRNISSQRLSDDLFKIWSELALSDDDRARLGAYLSNRIPDYISESRAIPDIDLLRRIDPARSAELLELRQVVGERQEIAKQEMLSHLQGQRVNPEILDNLTRDGASIETLKALSVFGVSAGVLSQLVRMFPTFRGASLPREDEIDG